MGRIDLVKAAEEAAKFPDRDQGLDHLLGRLPSQAVAAPRLEVEPASIDLGALRVGEDRRFSLELTNAGGRIISGSLAANCKWLAPSENSLADARLIQFPAPRRCRSPCAASCCARGPSRSKAA